MQISNAFIFTKSQIPLQACFPTKILLWNSEVSKLLVNNTEGEGHVWMLEVEVWGKSGVNLQTVSLKGGTGDKKDMICYKIY